MRIATQFVKSTQKRLMICITKNKFVNKKSKSNDHVRPFYICRDFECGELFIYSAWRVYVITIDAEKIVTCREFPSLVVL